MKTTDTNPQNWKIQNIQNIDLESISESTIYSNIYTSDGTEYYNHKPWIKTIYNNPNQTTINVDSWNYQTEIGYSTTNKMTLRQNELRLEIKPGEYVTVSREELVKYISEQEVIRKNEVVRKMFERYQVALKLARSEDDDERGE